MIVSFRPWRGNPWEGLLVTTPLKPVVLVSGANRGIGKAVALELRAHGYRLSLAARQPEKLAGIFGAEDETLIFNRFDVFDKPTAAEWVERTVARFGGIDGLVNNAGLGDSVTIRDDDEETLDRLWAVNVKGPLRMTRLCLPYLEASGQGRIINVASLSGKRVRNPNVGYNMSKFAVMGLTHATRFETWDKGVRVAALCPSLVNTDMTAGVTLMPREEMIQPKTLAILARTLIELPNNAAIAELLVNCRYEHMI